MPERREALGTRLRRLRTAAGLTQQDLASQAGLSMSAVTQMELGKRSDPKLSTLRALAGVLGVSVVELIDDLEEVQPLSPEPRKGKKK